MLLFTTLGIVAGDFFSVNLSSIAHSLSMSDTLAGVTFLALGNGAPDIFSTFAAMNSNSQSLALGELIGAAAFITSVVAGSMALVRPFPVVKASLVRDAIFLMVAVTFLIYVLVDQSLRLWHCISMLILYVGYVGFVMGWHWWLSHKAKEEDSGEEQPSHDEEGQQRSPTETTRLISDADRERRRHATSKLTESGKRRKRIQSLWRQDCDEEAPRIVDYRFINPSLLDTLQFRQNEYYKKQEHNRHKLPTHHDHDHAQDSLVHDSTDPRSGRQDDDPSREAGHPATSPRWFTGHILQILFPTLQNLKSNNALHRFINIATAPSVLVIKVTLPVVDDDSDEDLDVKGQGPKNEQSSEGWDRWLLLLQAICGPQFMLAIIAHQASIETSHLLIPALAILSGSAVFSILVLLATTSRTGPRWFKILSIPGFLISIAWISTVADEMVGVLKALGVICNISEVILGLTVFAVGNSLDDLATNVSMAQHRHPVMALSACFGGPLLNILLGIGGSGIIIFAKEKVTVISLGPSSTLFITAGTVIATLIALVTAMLFTKWTMTKLVGSVMITVWIVGTGTTLVINHFI